MRTVLLLFLLIGFSAVCVAQRPGILLSEGIKVGQQYRFEGHLYSGNNMHLVYFTESGPSGLFGIGEWPVVEKFDANFNLVYSKAYKLDKKGLESYGMKFFKGQILWLISELDSKKKNRKFSIVPITTDGRRLRAIPVGNFKYDRKDDRPTVNWAISEDSSMVLFQAAIDNDEADLKMSIYNSVLNESLGTVWSEQFRLDYSQAQYEHMQTVLKNDGSVSVLGKVYNDERAKESRRDENRRAVANYEIVLWSFSPDQAEPRKSKLDLGSAFIRGASLASQADNSLKCAGFFADSRSGAITGVFYLALDPDGSVQVANKKSFSGEDLAILGRNNTQQSRDGTAGLEDRFRFSDILLRPDGSAVVIAEQNFYQIFQRWTGRFYTSYIQYFSMDIVAFFISPSGTVSGITVIPKFQSGTETDYFLSYIATVRGNDIVFYYNEDVANLRRPVNNPDPRPVSSFNDAVAVMTVLKSDGTLERQPLFEASEVGSLFFPKRSAVVGPDKLFFVGVRGRLGSDQLFLGSVTRY